MTCPIGTNIQKAAEIVRDGGLVAFATETVYGLGANALDVDAVAKLFEVKERPRFDPIICHISSATQLETLVDDVPDVARRMAECFWPGPLTMVLEKKPCVPDLVSSGLPTVGVRVPNHPVALELLRAADTPIAAPSANRFGQISPTCAEHVAEQLGERIDYILDGGPCPIGVESTVVEVTETGTRLLRPGGLPVEEIERRIGEVEITVQRADDSEPAAQLAPGMLPKHYAPTTQLVLSATPVAPLDGERVGLLTLMPLDETSGFTAVEVLSQTGRLAEAAAGFFAAMRRLDGLGLDRIIATPFPEAGLGRALNDRLRRASAP